MKKLKKISRSPRSHNKGTVVFLCRGTGEYAQGEAVAHLFRKIQFRVVFLVIGSFEISLAESEGFEAFKVDDVNSTYDMIDELRPDCLFLCNSKIRDLVLADRPNVGVIASLDSNWLFNQTPKCWIPNWIDRLFVVFPKKVFDLGLTRNGGYYELSDLLLSKISPVGFLPTVQPASASKVKTIKKQLGLVGDQKMILGYFGRSETFVAEPFQLLTSALSRVSWKSKIKLFLIGPESQFSTPPIGVTTYCIENPSKTDFEDLVLSSDLLIQHHGMGTLSKAIHGQIPVISFTISEPPKQRNFKHSEYYEVAPFEKLGLCKRLNYDCSSRTLQDAMEGLLFDPEVSGKMRKVQSRYAASGEEAVVEEVLEMIQISKRRSA